MMFIFNVCSYTKLLICKMRIDLKVYSLKKSIKLLRQHASHFCTLYYYLVIFGILIVNVGKQGNEQRTSKLQQFQSMEEECQRKEHQFVKE